MTDPLVIEVAITPLRRGAASLTVDAMVEEASGCIEAGAGIVHHHHDMQLDETAAVDQLLETSRRIQAAHPGSLVYTDYLAGKRAWEENAHLRPMAEAGVLSMFAIDPGVTSFPSADEGIPNRTYLDGLQFAEAHEMVRFSKEVGVPISLGVFEPGHLRWVVAYAARVGFSPGTMIKLYFGGSHMVDRPGTPGINFGLPPTTAALEVYRSMMSDCGLPWTVSLFGDPLLDSELAPAAIEVGGHVRVGVEDAAGMTELSNVEMVEAAVELASAVGRPVASGAAALAALTAPAPLDRAPG